MSWFVTFKASSRVLPLTSSVRADELAMALAQPKVWNLGIGDPAGLFVYFKEEFERITAYNTSHLTNSICISDLTYIPGMQKSVL